MMLTTMYSPAQFVLSYVISYIKRIILTSSHQTLPTSQSPTVGVLKLSTSRTTAEGRWTARSRALGGQHSRLPESLSLDDLDDGGHGR
jgi:hypothetical protein